MTEPAAGQLRISEIFLSLQGETSTVGLPTVFVRLTGCPLRCQYCDTAYAFSGGEVMNLEDILARVRGLGVTRVTVTGGEPLAQPACHELLTNLCEEGFAVSLETSGALDVAGVDERVAKIIDVKTPGSAEVSRNRWENLSHCGERDQLKFVICHREDYEWARLKCEEHGLFDGPSEVLFSPSSMELPARDLADWIVHDRLPVRMQIQLHKYLWGDEPGR
ncbi:MAG: 7-carboxy-7-deazaguanine synthase QueE [Pseudomonadales bacterium]|nr:7-carboxy-7-deazaguanine synthase QueE [Pseudomonadales bacterium]NIX09891.1 7-carboxy-7-deazaguanine synthase QueE [Pseudomonadales bacterium]